MNAYAHVRNDGEILIYSVHDSELGAMINTIVKLSNGELLPSGAWNLSDIELAYHMLVGNTGSIRSVDVKIKAN